MSRRDNFKSITEFKTPDKLIVDLFGCPLSGMADEAVLKLNRFLGYDDGDAFYNDPHSGCRAVNEKMLRHYDIDTRGIGDILAPYSTLSKKVSETENVDIWGITRKYTGLYWDIVKSPLEGATLDDLKNYPFPDPDTVPSKDLENLRAQAKYLWENTDYLLCASHPTLGVFELGCWMCGFEDFLFRMAAEPEFVHCFFGRVLEYQKKISEMYYRAVGEYIHYTSSGDDFATQYGTFMSVEMFDEMIAPYLKERISFTKKFTKAKFLHHSCGNVETLIPSLIDCGVEILNPVQPVSEQMLPAYLKPKYKGKMVFHGGYDTQRALPKNTPEQIDCEVKEMMTQIKQGGGFIFAAAHNIQVDVSPENIDAFLSASKKYK